VLKCDDIAWACRLAGHDPPSEDSPSFPGPSMPNHAAHGSHGPHGSQRHEAAGQDGPGGHAGGALPPWTTRLSGAGYIGGRPNPTPRSPDTVILPSVEQAVFAKTNREVSSASFRPNFCPISKDIPGFTRGRLCWAANGLLLIFCQSQFLQTIVCSRLHSHSYVGTWSKNRKAGAVKTGITIFAPRMASYRVDVNKHSTSGFLFRFPYRLSHESGTLHFSYLQSVCWVVLGPERLHIF
jgi:hypothetical protein